jgi:sodium transport system permease protein
MKKVLVIFKKEIRDTLRDRRTIMMMLVLPILLIYAIMNITITLSRSQVRKAEEKELTVAVVKKGEVDTFLSILEKRKNILIKEDIEADEGKITHLIREKELDFAVVFDENFDDAVKEGKSGGVDIYFKASRENDIAKKRIHGALKDYKEELLALRIKELNDRYEELAMERSFVEPLEVNEKDLASMKEKLGETVGGFLPYIFVIFCFLGAMYPAIDLAAGEKERATIETLLSSPASRLQIVLGKFLVVTLAGLISAGVSILALYLSIMGVKDIPQQVLDSLVRVIELESVGMLLSLLLPLCVFFAALLLSFSVFARSFKEAQSIITPLNFMVIIPVMIGLFPGIKLNTATALIPVLNVSLATKEIISGTIQTGLLVEVYLSLFLLAALSLFFCVKWFNREEVIFRGI